MKTNQELMTKHAQEQEFQIGGQKSYLIIDVIIKSSGLKKASEK